MLLPGGDDDGGGGRGHGGCCCYCSGLDEPSYVSRASLPPDYRSAPPLRTGHVRRRTAATVAYLAIYGSLVCISMQPNPARGLTQLPPLPLSSSPHQPPQTSIDRETQFALRHQQPAGREIDAAQSEVKRSCGCSGLPPILVRSTSQPTDRPAKRSNDPHRQTDRPLLLSTGW